MKTTTLRFLTVAVMIVMTAFSVHAEDWETITSGWRPEHILAVNDDIWASAEGGLLHLDPATLALEVLNVDNGLFSSFLACIEYDSTTGYIWIGHTNAGLDIYDPVKRRLVQTIRDFYNDQSVRVINDIFIDNDHIFVASDQGLSRMSRYQDEEEWVVLETYRGFGNWSRPTAITDVTVFDGRIWVASDLGIAWADVDANLLNVSNWTTIGNQAILPGIETTGVQFLKPLNGTLYLSYYLNDLLRWNGNAFEHFVTTDRAFDMTVTPEGHLYMGRGNGLYRKRANESEFVQVNSDYTAKFWGVTVLNGDIWGAVDTNLNYFGGLARWNGGEFDHYFPNTPGGDQILTAETSPDGEIWLAAKNSRIPGVFRQSDGTWYPYAEPNQPQAPWGAQIAINAIEFDNHGGTWIGTWGNSAYYIRPKDTGGDTLIYFDHNNSELAGVTDPESDYIVVNGFEPDPGGGLWMSNMAAYDDSTLVYIPERWFILGPDNWNMSDWVRYGPLQGLDWDDVSLIEMDSQGRLWLSSIRADADYPLVMMDPNGTPMNPGDDSYFYFNTDRAGYIHVNDMKMSEDGLLWLGTPDGLFYIDTSLQPEQVVFTKVFGALGQSITALAVDPLGQIWVGTDFGLSVLGRDRFTWIAQYTTNQGPYPSGLVDNQVTALTVDPATGDIYVGTNEGLSVVTTPYREFGDDLGEIEVAPQPFLVGDPSSRLHFSSESLVADAEIRIFTLSGRLVDTVTFQEASAEGWDGRNEDGEWVGSGVYYIVVTGPDGSSKTGKVAVVRE